MANWDTAELQTVPYILGIPHPSGFPLFVLIGWAFTHAVFVGTVAWRMNVLSSLCLAITSTMIWKISVRFGSSRIASIFGSLIFCAGSIVLKKSTHTDVHAMSTMWFALMLYSLLEYVRGDDDRSLLLVALFEGLGLGTHLTAIWWLPAIAIALIFRRASRLLLAKAIAVCAIVVICLYAYLPLRSAFPGVDPNLTLGITSGDFWNTNHPDTIANFVKEVTGSDFGAQSAVLDSLSPIHILDCFALLGTTITKEFLPLSFIIAIIVLIGLIERSPVNLLVLIVAGIGSVPFALAYSHVEGDVERYLLPSFVVYAVLISAYRSKKLWKKASVIALQFTLLMLLVSLNAPSELGERLDTGGDAAIATVEEGTPSNAIVDSLWIDSASFAYARYVENTFGTRYVVSEWPGALKDRFASIRKHGPIFVFLPTHNIANLTDAVPKSWLTFVPISDSSHALVEVCKNGCK